MTDLKDALNLRDYQKEAIALSSSKIGK